MPERLENSEAGAMGSTAMRRKWHKALWTILGLVIVGVLLYRFRNAAVFEGFSWAKLEASLGAANVPLLLLAFATIFASYAMRALRWTRFSRYMGRPQFGHVYGGTVMGFTAIFLLGRAGEPLRPLLIARKDRLPIAPSFGVYILERIFDAAATAVLAICVLLRLPSRALAGTGGQAGNLLHAARIAGWAMAAGLIFVFALLIYFRLHGAGALRARMGDFKSRGGWRARIAGLMDGFGEGLQAIRSFEDLFLAVVYTAVHWLIVGLVYYWTMEGFRGRAGAFDYRAALLVLAFTMVGSVAQLPGIGGGMQIAAFLVLTAIFGVEKEPAAAIAILIWLISFAGVSVVGLPWLVHEGWSMGKLRRLAEEEKQDEERGGHASLANMAEHTRKSRT